VDGATQTELPGAAIAPGPLGTNIRDLHGATGRVELGVHAAHEHVLVAGAAPPFGFDSTT
jgi:hypothetical protein